MSAPVIRAREPHEPKVIANGDPLIVYEGRIGAIVHFPVLEDQGHGYVARTFEKFARPPGTRIIAVKDGKIFLQQELRLERDNVPDWRLPGGKVFDSFSEFKPYLNAAIPEDAIRAAAAKELREEAHLSAAVWRVFGKKECGATVTWDLWYLVAEDIAEEAAIKNHHEGEDIQKNGWFSFAEIEQKCRKGEISEGRTVATLLEFIS